MEQFLAGEFKAIVWILSATESHGKTLCREFR